MIPSGLMHILLLERTKENFHLRQEKTFIMHNIFHYAVW